MPPTSRQEGARCVLTQNETDERTSGATHLSSRSLKNCEGRPVQRSQRGTNGYGGFRSRGPEKRTRPNVKESDSEGGGHLRTILEGEMAKKGESAGVRGGTECCRIKLSSSTEPERKNLGEEEKKFKIC